MTAQLRSSEVASDEAAILVLAGVAAGALLGLGVPWVTCGFPVGRIAGHAGDPALDVLAAPADDESPSAEDIAASKTGRAYLRAGRT